MLRFLALLGIIFGQRSENRAANSTKEAMATGLVAGKGAGGTAGHGSHQTTIGSVRGVVCVVVGTLNVDFGCGGLVVGLIGWLLVGVVVVIALLVCVVYIVLIGLGLRESRRWVCGLVLRLLLILVLVVIEGEM